MIPHDLVFQVATKHCLVRLPSLCLHRVIILLKVTEENRFLDGTKFHASMVHFQKKIMGQFFIRKNAKPGGVEGGLANQQTFSHFFLS